MTRLAYDPPVSEKQRRAMEAAAHGHSTLGIPKKVGEEYINHDEAPRAGAGIMFTTPDGLALFLKRAAGSDHAGTWAWPGGGIEDGEDAEQAARREANEEIGHSAEGELNQVDHQEDDQGAFTTFHHGVDEHFLPQLNSEHTAYAWAPLIDPPAPLHPGVAKTLEGMDEIDMAELGQDEFKEEDHPRDEGGKFGSGGSGKKLDVKSMKKESGRLGSNEGGVYTHEGKKYYVKKPATQKHVSNEKAAARLYQLAGVNTLNYVDAGPDHVATEFENLDKNNIADFTPAERKEAAKDFAVHAWLSNWDAAGLGGDNQGMRGDKPVTLDVGGSLRYRAQGAPKGPAFGNKVGELDTLRDPNMNPDNARLFGKMSDDEIKSSIKKVTDIPDDKIRETVGDDKELADQLIARKNDMAKRFGIAQDQMAFDYSHFFPLRVRDKVFIAFDRASVRRTDADGRLHVDVANISKANVCPYLGREIPGWQAMGLDPEKMYRLYRDPEELEKAAPTFNNLPVLSEHVEVNADDHRPDLLVGTTGSESVFAHPFLKNSLAVWTKDAIDDVEKERKRQLSSAYRYRADMTPGTSPDGEDYDGVMRDIIGNHVALVEEGRAGPDVVVGDSTEELRMSKLISQKALMARGAIAAFLQPRLAADAKMPSLTSILLGVNAKNFKERSPAIIASLSKAMGPKFAKDNAEGLKTLLDSLAPVPVKDDMDPSDDIMMDEPKPADPADLKDPGTEPLKPPDPMEAIMTFLQGKLTPEDMAELEALVGKGGVAEDDPPDFKGKPEVGGKLVGDADKEDEMEKIDKPAMDKAIAKAKEETRAEVAKTNREIREAERAVKPYIGEVTRAFDSAAELYKSTLEALKVDITGVPAEAYPAMLKLVPVPGAKAAVPSVVVMDAATHADFDKRFPNASRIGSL